MLHVAYLGDLSLKRRHERGITCARMLDAAQEFTFDVDFSTLDRAREELGEWNAFDTDLDSRLRRRSRPSS